MRITTSLEKENTFGMFYQVPRSNIDCLMMQLLLLNVSNNKLKSLPESIGSCFSLEELQANGTFKSFSNVMSYHILTSVAYYKALE